MPGELIPITAIVFGIGVVFWSMYLDHQKKKLQFQERVLMIEKGLTPPPMLADEPRRRGPHDSLRRGIVMVCLGLGLAVGASIAGRNVEEEVGGMLGIAAAIVGFIGLGHLLFHFLTRRPDSAAPPPDISV